MATDMTDRSATLLSELQVVCQRILANDGRTPGAQAALATMASVADGSAVADSLEALRRQCADNQQVVAELTRSVDAHRGVLADDRAATGTMLAELGRSVHAVTEVIEHERTEDQAQMGELVRSVESLRIGLAGFSANNRQQVTELRSSIESIERTVSAFGSQIQTALNTLAEQIQNALDTLRQHVAVALGALSEHVGAQIASQSAAYQALVDELQPRETRERLEHHVGLVMETLTERVSQDIARQRAAYDDLLRELQPEQTRQRMNDLEAMLSIGLPQFSEEIQAGVQQTLLEVSRTLQLTEREHGNRMSELHRDFDTTTRRLEATLQARRREESVN